MIQKTDEFTCAVQGEGCGCAGCDVTHTAEAVRSRLQFLNRVDDVQVDDDECSESNERFQLW